MKIKYKIKMLSDWHVGSGLDAGADADALVLKNQDGLPYIPGKTLKGLLKDALLDMKDVEQCDEEALNRIFGYEAKARSHKGSAFFANAELPKQERKEITSNGLAPFLYRNIASTRIGQKGIAKKGSLRTMEVTQPVELESYIADIEANDVEMLEKAFKWLRRLGVNRNRGLGRCQFSITEKVQS